LLYFFYAERCKNKMGKNRKHLNNIEPDKSELGNATDELENATKVKRSRAG
jgi:hypothetical protein